MGAFFRSTASAQRQIERLGTAVELVRFLAVDPADPSKPWRTGAAQEVKQTVRGLFFDYTQRMIDGTLVQAGDRVVIVAAPALANVPDLKGEVRVGTVRWKIVKVQPLSPNGEGIMFAIQVRQ